jgi:peptidoglycan/LPS O-acetylase OafA/YrhL
LKYRSEIDGLRALAVIPVILFHAGFEYFRGGFVGVDVFFVISGYLITSIIINDLENKEFSLLNFYERRARRILPALFFMMFISIPFAWLLMTPIQMKDFSQSLVAVSFFVSNILFWLETGYFEADAELKPLLHTWSLSIEEQFYIIFPIFLLFIWRFFRNNVFLVLSALALASLVFSEWSTRNFLSASFYLAPARMWELLIGSLAALYLQKREVKKNNLLSTLGLIAVVYSIISFDQSTPFPSLYTLVPVLGVLLVVIYGSKETLIGSLLSNKLLVGIGLISYSAYLWHQPLLAFVRLKMSGEPANIIMLSVCLFSFILAYFSWKFIEKPMRNKKIVSGKQILSMSLVGLLFFSLVGTYGHISNGYRNLMLNYKYTQEESKEAIKVFNSMNYHLERDVAAKPEKCKLWARNSELLNLNNVKRCYNKYGKAIVILGDSHAINLFNILALSNTYPFIIGISQGSCHPHNPRVECHYDEFQKFAVNNESMISILIFHQSGAYLISDSNGVVDSDKSFTGDFFAYDIGNIKKVKFFLNEIVTKSKIKTIWVGPFLEFRRSPEKTLFTEELKTVNPISIALFNDLDEIIKSTPVSQELFQYYPFKDFFYEPKNSFVGSCFVFQDKDHYSRCGEKIIAEKLEVGFLDNNIKGP